MMLTLVLLCCTLIGPIVGTSPFTNHEERMCGSSVLPGYEKCICTFKPVPVYMYQLTGLNCTDLGFDEIESVTRLRMLTNFLIDQSYTELQKFVFTGNAIYELPENIVGRNTLENLALMDLSNNKIHTINKGTFHSMPSLTELYFDNNDWYVDEGSPRLFSSIFNLEILSLNNAFASSPPNDKRATRLSTVFEGSSLDYLRELYLENNNLVQVEYSTFQHLISLEVLSLAHNHISSAHGIWNSTCFVSEYVADYMGDDNLCNLRQLDLSYNDITTVPKSLLDELDKIDDFNTLNLTGNPLSCDCELLYFYDWLKRDIDNDKYTVADHQGLTCHQPVELQGRPIISLDREELKRATLCGLVVDKGIDQQEGTKHEVKQNGTSYGAIIVLGSFCGLMLLIIIVALVINYTVVKMRSDQAGNAEKQFSPEDIFGYKKF